MRDEVYFPFWMNALNAYDIFKGVDNNFIFSICASPVILLINLGHDGVQFVIHLFIPPILPQRLDKWLDFHKKSLYMEVQNSQAVLLVKRLLLHDQHLHFLWYLCGSESNKMLYIYCLTIFSDISVRPCLQGDSYSPGFQWPVIQTCYQKILQNFSL